MSRGRKVALVILASLVGLVVVLFLVGITVVRTDWFRNMVRGKIVSSVETATGGRADVGSFSFDWRHLRADVADFTIHGLEPAGGPPLFHAKLVEVDLKLLSPFKGMVDIAALKVDTPRANVIVYPDGHTNIPEPKLQHSSNKTGLETIVNLAVGHFDLQNGSLLFAERKIDFNGKGDNLRAQLAYNPLHPSYSGEIDMSPLHVRSGNNAPLDIDIKLPVTLETDRIKLAGAQLSTPGSRIDISGTMVHLVAPRTSGHVSARVALDEARNAAGLEIPLDTRHGPRVVNADVTASMDDTRVQIQSARINLGQSEIAASGTLTNASGSGDLRFSSSLALGEIGRLLRVAARPEGTVRIGGDATMATSGDHRGDYLIKANLDGRNIAVGEGSSRLRGISIDSNITADPHRIELGRLRLNALGGNFAGSGSVQELSEYRLSGKLSHFDLQQMASAFAPEVRGYSGTISGDVDAHGSVKNTSGLVAHASLGVAPGTHGVPVSGRMNVDYNGRGDTVTLGRSYLTLPSTRVDLAGALGQQIRVQLVTHNLADLRPIAVIPVTFNRGSATVNATVSGKLSRPQITAQFTATNFSVEGRPFTNFGADVSASPFGASVTNGALTRGALQMQFSGAVGLRAWKPEPNQSLRADATIRNADLADVLALAGQPMDSTSGSVTADAHINGTVGDPRGDTVFTVSHGTIEGESFDTLTARAVMTDHAIEVPTLQLIAGPSRLDASATYQHSVNDLVRGTLRAHVSSNQVQLAQFQSLVKDRPGLRGTLSLNADASATIQPAPATRFQITSLNGTASARGLEMEGKNLGDFTATANTAGSTIRYNVNSDFAGSTIHVTGQSALTGNHETNADAQISNLPIDRVLALAGRRDLPLKGTLATTARVAGTIENPHVAANLNISNGSTYQEPFTRLQATVNYSNQSIDVPQFRVEDGAQNIELTASFTHPANDLEDGQIRFHVRSNQIQLSRRHTIQEYKPGLAGTVELAADGAATLHRNAAPQISVLNANLATKGLTVDHKPMGDLTATAETRGREVQFDLNSNFARANIRGSGRVELAADYPVNARLDFSNVTWSGLSNWVGAPTRPTFDASMNGQATVSGPATRVDGLRATLQLSKVEAHSITPATGIKPRVQFELHNADPIVVSLDRGVATIQNARITGPYTNVALSGTASLRDPQKLNLRADGNIKLEMLEAFDANIFSAGNVTLNAAITGTTAQPSVNGRLRLQNASFNMVDLPNGLSNATGTVAFNGSDAIIENLTGESGGGKITLAGSVSYGGPQMQFRVETTADHVHVEYPATVTTTVSARLTLAGTEASSLLSGTVRVNEVVMHSHSDVGSMLTAAAEPPASPSDSTGLLAGMRFDVRLVTSSDAQFRTSLTQDLQADANLTLRGNPDHPGMLGRIAVTQGEVIFFGAKYTINQGTISFYNPQKIDPILNVDLQTKVQGIDVSLGVSGPVDRMKLSYSSDPPLQLTEIVSLLASGKAPTSDPVLAAREPPAPQQNFRQEGASMLLGQAVASPVSGRLQRLFGVSSLKIDPQVTGASNTPQAKLTLQQQITREITFTYIQDVTQSNSQIIRMEWAINPRWSAIAARDLTGEFNLDLFYKKRFK